ncbi:peptidoglycan DD-metalloendopeptidase family protein [Chelatococcus sambhunathii]|uniref:Peptidoglycan DD-metalloendopeptidase family protein n=1 Tax=Chelatococcus sambhunathii TaxID=363953 RepID=A0ABU1DKL0_9HYPH|nr:peptidoglycan DD-metalloendopeptidase family protein [Chelatococcus sambhunathii]MDR4308420.1 peptidoglycan DD-metalloendopeptidase family protein [Chelatococcus sambhunathii]
MRNFVPCLRSRLMVRVAAVALASGSVAACSSDSTRFGEDPFSNPFKSASSAPARSSDGDIPTGAVRPAPSDRVERAPLGAPSAAQSRPMYGYGGGPGGGSYQSSRLEPRSTATVSAPRPAPMASADPNWSSSGGTMITVGRGETVHTISARYGVPASAIMKANNLSSADVGEGRQILLPTYSASAGGYRAAAAAPAEPKAFGARAALPAPRAEISVAAPKPVAPKVAVATPAVDAKVKMRFEQGAQAKGFEAKPVEPKPVEIKTAQVRAPEIKAEAKLPEVKAKLPAVKSEQAFAAAPAKVQAPVDDNVKTAALKVDPAPAAEPAGPSFRWPARGRVISAYGSKSSGASNDGVNIAVPEGTDVKASDDGVVAYAGSELKGFGNLVLIRHSNGWVTAYAHNSALEVKRGETVRRGQIIAKSGSTGNVTSPQLHFEVRKGAQTVDPMKHLPDA